MQSRTVSKRVQKLVLLLVILLVITDGPLPSQTPTTIRGVKIARIEIKSGQAFLQNRAGKPVIVPNEFDLSEGDMLTTSERISGRFVLASGQVVVLAPLKRYRIGGDAIFEAAGPRGWKKIPRVIEDVPIAPSLLPTPTSPGLIAKVRLLTGRAFKRAASWPQEIPISHEVSLAQGDDLRVDRDSRALVLLAQSGWLRLIGPALVAFPAEGLLVDSGEGMAKGLVDHPVKLGPYRIEAGPNAFTFKTAPGGLTVAALGGIIAIGRNEDRTVLIAPGRRALFERGVLIRIERLDIRSEARHYEQLFCASKVVPPPVSATAETISPKDQTRTAPGAKRAVSGNARVSNGSKLSSEKTGSSDARRAEPHALRTTLSLRDRLRALDSRRSRYYYSKKREELEARLTRDAYAKQIEGGKMDEVTSWKLFKLNRALTLTHRDLDDVRHDRELAFEERLNLYGPERDRAVRAERERLFGQPLFLLTRRLLPQVEATRAQATVQADALTLQIDILKQTGGTGDAISRLIRERQDVLDQAERESDALKEQIRIQVEPHR